ncbi:MAG TPA: hypothetical protein DHV53_07065 [Gammaproteobacteria bacterium]|nr:hypothetical protein [Gammaproteobacteria bacterium]|tara:strand:+ start:1282 stop:2409 length:1128 start_codon:yes stop_codon:yes gene_type:complete
MSFYTSLTGLNAATKDLAVTSNNIANTETTGFKRSEVKFSDLFATTPGAKASSATGTGTKIDQVSQEFSQGDIENSDNVLDLAISGDGFFPIQAEDGTRVFTRNGGFMLDSNNLVVNSEGYQLLGKSVDAATGAATGELGLISIPSTILSTTAETAKVTFANLKANETLVLGGITLTAGTDGATAAEVAAAFTNIAKDGAADASGATIASATGTLTGWSTSAANGTSITFTSITTGDVADLANTGTGSVAIVSSPANHDFTGLTIDADGMMSASYSDGSVVKTAQILLAKFASNEGLVQSAGSSYSATNKSGEAVFAAGGEPGYGTILSGSVERSNVDITAELVDLIKAQRNFQANAKAIETNSSLASTLINMRG